MNTSIEGGWLQFFVGWSTFLVLSVAILAFGAIEPVAWTMMCMAVLILFALHLIDDVRARRPLILGRLVIPAILFLSVLLWAIVQRVPVVPGDWVHPVWTLVEGGTQVVSADPESGREVIWRYATYAMVFWIAVCCGLDRDASRRFSRAFALFSSVLAGFGIYALFSGNNIVLGDAATNVLTASFVNRNSYATFAVFGALANLAVFLQLAQTWELQRSRPIIGFLDGFFSGGWFWMLGVVIGISAVLLTESRAGVAAGGVGLVVFALSYRSRREGSAITSLALVAIVVGAVVFAASGGVLERMMSASGEDMRFAIYPRIVDGILDRPWLGHGLGAFQDAFRPYVPIEAGIGEWDMAHNSYLELAFELGLPAAAAVILALVFIVGQILYGLRKRKKGRAVMACAVGCAAAAAFHAMFDFSLQMPALTATFLWILGLGYAQSFREKELTSRVN